MAGDNNQHPCMGRSLCGGEKAVWFGLAAVELVIGLVIPRLSFARAIEERIQHVGYLDTMGGVKK
jgi:hypothetical protein